MAGSRALTCRSTHLSPTLHHPSTIIHPALQEPLPSHLQPLHDEAPEDEGRHHPKGGGLLRVVEDRRVRERVHQDQGGHPGVPQLELAKANYELELELN